MTARGLAITGHVLDRQRRALALWAVAVAAVAAMYGAAFPLIAGSGDAVAGLLAAMPEDLVSALGFDDLATASGYLGSAVYAMLGIALLIVYGVSQGARLVAGEEESGTLELELVAPLTRTRVYTERLCACWIALVVLVTALTLTVVTVNAVAALQLRATNVLAAGAMALLLTGLFSTVAYACGAATGRRGLAIGVAAGAAVVSFVLDALGPMLDIAWMSAVSPFHWYLGDDPLANGMDWPGAGLLAGSALVCAFAGHARFARRDTMV